MTWSGFYIYSPQANGVQFALLAAGLSGLTQYPFLLLWFEGLTSLMKYLAYPTHFLGGKAEADLLHI